MKVSDFLLNQVDIYNGHLQLCIGKMTLVQVNEILLELNDLQLEKGKWFYLTMDEEDHSASLYQKDFWAKGEHPMGHTDRLIFGIEKVLMPDQGDS